jgi:hypothetical protein
MWTVEDQYKAAVGAPTGPAYKGPNAWHGEFYLRGQSGLLTIHWPTNLGEHWFATTLRIGYVAHKGLPAWSVLYTQITAVTQPSGGVVQLSAAGQPHLASFKSDYASHAAAGIIKAANFARTPEATALLRAAQMEECRARAAPLLSELPKADSDRLRLRLATMVPTDLPTIGPIVDRLVQLQEVARRGTMPADAIAVERARILSL